MDTASDKALQRFAELMIEKIQQVEDNWQQPWFSTKGGGLPQNIDGRNYNGVNSFMLFLLTEKEQYGMPVYMTFMQAKEKGLNVLKGEHSFPVVYWNFSIKDKNGKKITMDQYRHLSREEQENYKVTPYMKTYNVFNVNQTNLKEVKPELYEQLENRFKAPGLKDEKGMFTMPLLDVMIREQKWVCPIQPKEGNQAYYVHGEKNGHIVVPLKGQFEDGESFYATLMHEMAHSTGEVHLLNREKGVVFGDDKYAKEELIAELTAATTGQAMGITTSIREENAMYLKNWLAALKEDPKFIYSILSDVGKASGMIQERSREMLPLLSPEEKFMVGVIQENKELLEDLKKEGFVPAPELMERIDSSHLTEEMKEHLDRQFGIADKPESASFTLEDVMASVPLRKMYMKDMIEMNLEMNDRTANDWMEAYQERKTMNNDFSLAL